MPSSNPPFPHLITIHHPCTHTLTYLLHADNTCTPAPPLSSNLTLLTHDCSSPDSNPTPFPSEPNPRIPSRHPLCPSCYSACEQAIVDRYAANLGDAVVRAHREGRSEDEVERVYTRVWEEYERVLGELERVAGGVLGGRGEVLLPRVVEGEGGDEVDDEEEWGGGEEAEMEAFRVRWREIGGVEEGDEGGESGEGRNDESGGDEIDSGWDDDGEFGYGQSEDEESCGDESDSEEQVIIV